MPEFITLSCPSCGGKLQITNDVERFACAHCGNEHLVRRSGGVVSIAPLAEGLARVQASVDRTASELAVKRLREEIQVLKSERPEVERRIAKRIMKLKEQEKQIGLDRRYFIRQALAAALCFLVIGLLLLSTRATSFNILFAILVIEMILVGVFIRAARKASMLNAPNELLQENYRTQIVQAEHDAQIELKQFDDKISTKVSILENILSGLGA